MRSLAWIRRVLPGSAIKLACWALGIAGMAVLLALSDGVDGNNPANGSQEQDKGGEKKAAAKDADVDQPEEAPTGFKNASNGFESQTDFDKDRAAFEEVETILPDKTTGGKGGLGPVYNATSCVSCHQNPVTGSSSQVSEIRAGHLEPDPKDPTRDNFVEPPGGSLIHQRAIDPLIQEHVPRDANVPPKKRVRTLRMSTNTLGNGFVEVIPDRELLDFRERQPEGLRGLAVCVPVTVKEKSPGEFETVWRIGRFGWKCQEASLLNFSAGAYLNEMGITNPLHPKENLSNGRDVSAFDPVGDPEDPAVRDEKDPHPFGEDVEAFTRFMRSTRPPPRDVCTTLAASRDVEEGEKIFKDLDPKTGKPLKGKGQLGCAVCHRPDYTTPKAGTLIRAIYPENKPGSDLKDSKVPAALGNKIIHPYSDFLLHDIGTGDGIAQTQHAQRPPRGVERLEAPSNALMRRLGMVRVQARPREGNRRVLRDVPGLDQRTRNMMRTAPLWGLRVRPQLLHDGSALTVDDAIRRHQVTSKSGDVALPGNFDKLTNEQKRKLRAFLNSL